MSSEDSRSHVSSVIRAKAMCKQRKVPSDKRLELMHRQKLIATTEVDMGMGERCYPQRRTNSWFPELAGFLLASQSQFRFSHHIRVNSFIKLSLSSASQTEDF